MKVLKIIGIIFLLFVIVAASGLFYLNRGLEEGLNLSIGSVDVARIGDGVYSGRHVFGRWTNELDVTIENKKITKIEIEDDVQFVRPEVSSLLFKRVIEKQSLSVDAISQATVTSKAYLKSIENALNN